MFADFEIPVNGAMHPIVVNGKDDSADNENCVLVSMLVTVRVAEMHMGTLSCFCSTYFA